MRGSHGLPPSPLQLERGFGGKPCPSPCPLPQNLEARTIQFYDVGTHEFWRRRDE